MGGSANLLTVPAVAYELVGVLETVLLLGGGLWPARTRFFLAQWNHTKCEGANPLQLGGGELWTLTNWHQVSVLGTSPCTQYCRIETNSLNPLIATLKPHSNGPLYSKEKETLISNRGRWSPLSLFRQVHLGVGKSEYNPPFSGLPAASTWEAVGFCGSHRQTDVLAKLSSWLGG